MNIDTICVDVDGVIADWLKAAIRAHGLNPDTVYAAWDRMGADGDRPWDFAKVLGVTPDEMWAPIHAAGHEWWANLEPFPWLEELYGMCTDIAPTYLLTSPSREPSSHSGKAEWIKRHFGSKFKDYLIGSPKHLCARPGAVLIDDMPGNCERFAVRGRSILFPSVSNPLHAQRERPLVHVAAMLSM